MAMDVGRLTNALKTAFVAAHQTNTGTSPTAPQEAVITNIASSLATAIITEISNATLTVTGAGLTAGGQPVIGSAATQTLF